MTFEEWWKENGHNGYCDDEDWFTYVESAWHDSRAAAFDECAQIAERIERMTHDSVGHPLITKFEPWIANAIRAAKGRE